MKTREIEEIEKDDDEDIFMSGDDNIFKEIMGMLGDDVDDEILD